MAATALSGNDSVVINNRVLSDLADGDYAMLDYPSAIASVKIGKNNSAIYGQNFTGQRARAALRVVRGSADDKYLLSLLTQQNANFSATVLVIGTFTKLLGDGKGNITNDTYILSGGVFVNNVRGKSSAEGDAMQSVAVYEIDFASAVRALT